MDRSLGWFSVGLGVTQLLAPKALGRMIGVGDQSTALRLCGVREIISGVGLLSGRAPATFAASRVVGDVIDLALLGAALRSPQADPKRIAAAATAVASVAAVDLHAARSDMKASLAEAPQDAHVTVALVMNSPPEKIYEFWRNFENLPRFMQHLESVSVREEGISHWVARGPAGRTVEWDARIINEVEDKLIGWQSLNGSTISTAGSVNFDETPMGTRVRVHLQYHPPGGRLGAAVARLFGEEPHSQVREDLRRFKALLEAGEIPTTAGQSSGREAR